MNKIFVIATGGTIAGTASSKTDAVNYTVGALNVNELLADIPTPSNVIFEGLQLAQIDSKDMSFTVWRNLALKVQEIADRPDVNGVVITHGTDTLEETAYFLHLTLNTNKPIILTAAMRPATALSADGPANLLDAITVASYKAAKGVICVLNGRIYGAQDIRKSHTYRLDAFNAGEAGAIGAIENGVIRIWRNFPANGQIINANQLPINDNDYPWVEIITSCAGVNQKIIETLVQAGVDGIIIAATGNGTIHEDLIKQANFAQKKGVLVAKAARVGDGVILGDDQGSIMPAQISLPTKARVLMILQLLTK